ncbi:MAG: cytochrome ubiquinol oxidase subunit I [Nitrospirota bacterium]
MVSIPLGRNLLHKTLCRSILKSCASFILLAAVFSVVPCTNAADLPGQNKKPSVSRDVYYETLSVVSGPAAPLLTDQDYPRLSTSPALQESRLVIWVLAQQHNYWGAFVFGVLVLAVLLEIGSLTVRTREAAQRYDGYAYEILRLVVLALSVAAALGGLLLFGLLALYPDLTRYLASVFRPFFLGYGVLLVAFSMAAYLYYSTWQGMSAGLPKWLHASLGVLACGLGTLLVLISNAWGSFMLSPAGVDQYGRFLGNYWQVLHTATWNALNVHRIAGHIVFGAAVVSAYAAYRALTGKTREDRVRYDRMAYMAALTMMFVLFTFQFGGYWLLREIYAYRQQMGITMLGGLQAWLGVVLAGLFGSLFLGINYYLWQRINAEDEGARYGRYAKYVFLTLAACMAVYITPHTFVMTPRELFQMGGQQHQVLGNYGVESAKNPAINIMMVVTMWSFVLWGKCRSRKASLSIDRFIAVAFLAGTVNILWLGIYGYYIPANVRVGLSVPMAMTTLSLVVLSSVVFRKFSQVGAGSHHAWESMSVRGYYALFFLAFAITWIMGLGGYRRSSVRLFWHVNEIMRDNSPWAFTHTVGFATNVITMNAIIFWLGLLLLVWMARLGKDRLEGKPSA